MKISIQSFFGVAPRVAPRYLAEGAAQVAINVEAFGQSLKPLQGPGVTSPGKTFPTDTVSLYKFGQDETAENLYWLSSHLDYDVVRSQISGSGTDEWTFWTGGPNPRATYDDLATVVPTQSIRLGLPAPASPLTGTVGEPSYCVIGGVRDSSIDNAPDCATSGVCTVNGEIDYSIKTVGACSTAGGSWEAGEWVTGAQLVPARITLTPAILSEVRTTFGLQLSTNNGVDYKTVYPSGGSAPQVQVTSAELNQMLPDNGLKISLDNEQTWSYSALTYAVTQWADILLSAEDVLQITRAGAVTVTVTGGTAPGSISFTGVTSTTVLVDLMNKTAGSPVNAQLSGSGVHVWSKGSGGNLVMDITWGAYQSPVTDTATGYVDDEATYLLRSFEVASIIDAGSVSVSVVGGTAPGAITVRNITSQTSLIAGLNAATSPVRANASGADVLVTSKGFGEDLVMTITYGESTQPTGRSATGSSLAQSQAAFIAAVAAAKDDEGRVLATAATTATDQVTVTAATGGEDVILVVRWGPSDGQKLSKTGTAIALGPLVTGINALAIDATYTGATAKESGDNIVVSSLADGKEAKLRIRWADDTSSYRSATGGTMDLGTLETRVYTYTWVLKEANMEWESAPYSAEEMPTFDVYADGSVTLTGFEAASVITANGWGPRLGTLHQRIYRAVNGVYLYVGEIPAGTAQYVDAQDADTLGEALPSTTWTPPDENLKGLVNLPNGMVAGFVGRELYFCEPYRPYAWPDIYNQSVDYPVVGLGRMDTTLAVLTTGTPYFIQGSAPDMLVMVKSDLEQACVAKRSIVSLGGAVFYASPDGLMMLSSGGSDILTRELMDRDDWQALHPETIHAYGHDNQYLAFHDPATDAYGNTTTGFLIDLKSKQFVRHNIQALAGFNDLRNDTLYLVDANGVLVKWGTGAYVAGKWRSKIFSQAQMLGFACAQLEAADLYDDAGLVVQAPAYPATVRFYCDRRLFYTWTVGANEYYSSDAAKLLAQRNPFRLPPLTGFLGRDWEIELDVTQEIFNVVMAQSMSEIATT